MQQPLIAPIGRGVLDPGTGHPVSDAYFTAFNSALADKGFVVTAADDLIRRGTHRLADADDIWACVLCDQIADGDAALRRRGFGFRQSFNIGIEGLSRPSVSAVLRQSIQEDACDGSDLQWS